MIIPDFPNKCRILFNKILDILRIFFDSEIVQIKDKNVKELNELRNEKNKYIDKIKELNQNINALNYKKSKTSNILNIFKKWKRKI